MQIILILRIIVCIVRSIFFLLSKTGITGRRGAIFRHDGGRFVSASPGGKPRWAHLKQKSEEEKETRKSRTIEENRKDKNERKKDKIKDTQGISNSTDAVEKEEKGYLEFSLVGSPPR